jgi:hypothetical protein
LPAHFNVLNREKKEIGLEEKKENKSTIKFSQKVKSPAFPSTKTKTIL